MPLVLKAVLVLTALVAAVYDLRVRRIPNQLNLCGLVLGLGLNLYFSGLHGIASAAGGLLLALLVYMPLYAVKGMGAGDVKLMAAIGAITGPANWLNIFVATALLGGTASLVMVFVRRRWATTFLNVGTIVSQLLRGKQPSEKAGDLTIHSYDSLKMPHGAVIAAGVLVFLALQAEH